MSCGHVLRWYDLFPIFSYLALRGKCRYCGAHISKQYPIVEAMNGALWMLCFTFGGYATGGSYRGPAGMLIDGDYTGLLVSLLACGVCSALIVLSFIDARTEEIPLPTNIVIFMLGLCRMILDIEHWYEYVIGAFTVSGVLFIAWLVTKGNGIGGGDIKLMLAAGLFLGWKMILLALIAGCLPAVIVHPVRMRFFGAGPRLAMGPYLSVGILTAIWWGPMLAAWYLSLFV